MEETYLTDLPGVRKKILAGGTGPLPHFPPGAKVTSHSSSFMIIMMLIKCSSGSGQLEMIATAI